MKNRQYQGVQLSKKESELIQWLQKGEHDWFNAFYVYVNRKKNLKATTSLKERSWFNKTLAGLHAKKLCLNIPFILNGLKWRNPGIAANKANFVALSIQQVNHEAVGELHRAAI
jgi:hypothetical protein